MRDDLPYWIPALIIVCGLIVIVIIELLKN